MIRVAVALILVGCLTSNAPAGAKKGEKAISISVLSTAPDRISGGDALIRINVTQDRAIRAELNGEDVTDTFRRAERSHDWIGLVTGLQSGENKFVVRAGDAQAETQFINHPIEGPIVSGPHLYPFICQTNDFVLPDTSTLGTPLNANCSIETRVSYIYMSRSGIGFRPLMDATRLPADVAMTRTSNGKLVKFVVRIETKTINRGIYQSAVLHDPSSDAAPSAFAPPPAWNGVLIGKQGRGCSGGWYVQAGSPEIVKRLQAMLLDARRLGEGYAIFMNSLQNPSTSCNSFLAGETAMMSKEHFIESYGVPRYSISVGASGGAYTSLQIIDMFPGIFDGALVALTFPDALSIALSGMDAALLRHYFTSVNPGGFTQAQQIAVSGYKGLQAWNDAADQAARASAVANRSGPLAALSAVWNPAVPETVRYDPTTNPRGARPTIWDIARNLYGVDPRTGFALRVFDNVGVQYGLGALQSGKISPAQFIDLNRRIGGFDRDNGFVEERTVADRPAIEASQQYGLQLGGNRGLPDVPIVDVSGAMDEDAHYHYQWFHFAVRERLLRSTGHADNHVMWRGPTTYSPDGDWMSEKGFALLNEWVARLKDARTRNAVRTTLIQSRPRTLTDGCWSNSEKPVFVPELQTFSHAATTRCNRLWPSYGFPRLVAGGPLAADILKCNLKPLDREDLKVPFNDAEWGELQAIFPNGVCDWSIHPGLTAQKVRRVSPNMILNEMIGPKRNASLHDPSW